MGIERDINEIIASIKASGIEKTGTGLEFCLSRMTMPILDNYLSLRATSIQEQIRRNEDLRDALTDLSILCNENTKQCEQCPVNKYCNTYINFSKTTPKDAKWIVDLFCGAGGLSLGFCQEGFSVALANDIEECCIETYSHNHPEIPRNHIVKGDIRKITSHLEELIGKKAIDVVVGGPPCQGFSMANRQRLIDDPRNLLYRSYVEIVSRIRPRFFVMENVKGMLGVAPQVKEDFETLGYSVSYHILNAKDFGVPQNRERLIYIGNRINVDNEDIFKEIFEAAASIPGHTLKEALQGLRELAASRKKNTNDLGSAESGFVIERNLLNESNEYLDLINQGKQIPLVYNHKARYNNDRDIEIFGRMNQGDRADDPKIADIMPYARRNGIFKDKYFKLEESKICKTITAHMKFDCNMYIHPSQARGLTPREAARIQSYPDDYFFKGAYTKTFMQIGNSVPPLLGRVIASIIKKYV